MTTFHMSGSIIPERIIIKSSWSLAFITEEIGVGFLIKCNYTALLQASIRYKLDISRYFQFFALICNMNFCEARFLQYDIIVFQKIIAGFEKKKNRCIWILLLVFIRICAYVFFVSRYFNVHVFWYVFFSDL